MKPRGLLAAVIVLAALGGVLYWSNRKQKAEAAKPATDTAATTKILSIPEDQIKEVTLKKTGAETTVLQQGRRRQMANHRSPSRCAPIRTRPSRS